MARDPSRPGCALESRSRDEPLLATASRVRRWLLVEQPGPWGSEALLESRLDETVALTLRSHARRASVRVVLIRRPGWETSEGRRAYLVRSDRRTRWIEQVEIGEPHDLVGIDLSCLESPEPPGVGTPGPEAVHLVCTNGRHDPCCADLGRPVVRSLRDAGIPEVWESSHIGGDRFAANVVCLPTGTYYGRVPPEGAAQMLADHARGVLHLDHYRGRSCYQPLVQAAEVFAREALDEARLDGLTLRRATGTADHRLTATFEQAGGAVVEVDVAREPGPTERLTCHGGTSPPWAYRLEDLRTA
jgi:hypothetical protein